MARPLVVDPWKVVYQVPPLQPPPEPVQVRLTCPVELRLIENVSCVAFDFEVTVYEFDVSVGA